MSQLVIAVAHQPKVSVTSVLVKCARNWGFYVVGFPNWQIPFDVWQPRPMIRADVCAGDSDLRERRELRRSESGRTVTRRVVRAIAAVGRCNTLPFAFSLHPALRADVVPKVLIQNSAICRSVALDATIGRSLERPSKQMPKRKTTTKVFRRFFELLRSNGLWNVSSIFDLCRRCDLNDAFSGGRCFWQNERHPCSGILKNPLLQGCIVDKRHPKASRGNVTHRQGTAVTFDNRLRAEVVRVKGHGCRSVCTERANLYLLSTLKRNGLGECRGDRVDSSGRNCRRIATKRVNVGLDDLFERIENLRIVRSFNFSVRRLSAVFEDCCMSTKKIVRPFCLSV